jgi:hypothetical protein
VGGTDFLDQPTTDEGRPAVDIEELALFDEPPRTAAKAVSLAQTQRDLVPRWTDYHGPRRACDTCLRECHAGARTALPSHARFVRRVKATGDEVKLCAAHAEPIKAADWQASPAGKRAKAAGRRR